MATQNPIEQEGTYPLPEAQIDRFMLKVVVDYPEIDEEQKIINLNLNKSQDKNKTSSFYKTNLDCSRSYP